MTDDDLFWITICQGRLTPHFYAVLGADYNLSKGQSKDRNMSVNSQPKRVRSLATIDLLGD
jgi:hypothetical protein